MLKVIEKRDEKEAGEDILLVDEPLRRASRNTIPRSRTPALRTEALRAQLTQVTQSTQPGWQDRSRNERSGIDALTFTNQLSRFGLKNSAATCVCQTTGVNARLIPRENRNPG
jgi:hypothetical protein